MRNNRTIKNKGKNEKIILCFGGSLGAKKINECAIMIAEDIVKNSKHIKLIWGCGKREYSKCKELLKAKRLFSNDRIILRDYIDDMPSVIESADIVICRAGAMSVSEMAFNKKCTVFIPSPNVTNNHQYINAKALADKGAACLIEEKDINTVPMVVNELLENEEKRNSLSKRIDEFCVKNSNKIIFEHIKNLTN